MYGIKKKLSNPNKLTTLLLFNFNSNGFILRFPMHGVFIISVMLNILMQVFSYLHIILFCIVVIQ